METRPRPNYPLLAVAAALLVIAMMGAVILSAPVAAAPASAPKGNNRVVSSSEANVNVTAPRELTRAEMLSAIPMDTIEVEAQVKLRPEKASKGKSGAAPSGLPADLAGKSPLTLPAVASGNAFGAEGYTYPPPFTRYEIFTSYQDFPYGTIGRLFFTVPGVGTGSCSAASIGNYAVYTAGHCVHEGNNSANGWHTNFVFVPAYRDGYAPLGQWTAANAYTLKGWYKKGNPGGLHFDVGGLVLNTYQGNSISGVVGWLGFAWNQKYDQHWRALGYPAEGIFDGSRLIVCEASFAYSVSVGSSGPLPQVIGCDMTGGSSGGPWIKNFSGGAGATNYLNGVNSFRRRGKPKEMASPHFTNGAKNLWQAIIAATP